MSISSLPLLRTTFPPSSTTTIATCFALGVFSPFFSHYLSGTQSIVSTLRAHHMWTKLLPLPLTNTNSRNLSLLPWLPALSPPHTHPPSSLPTNTWSRQCPQPSTSWLEPPPYLPPFPSHPLPLSRAYTLGWVSIAAVSIPVTELVGFEEGMDLSRKIRLHPPGPCDSWQFTKLRLFLSKSWDTSMSVVFFLSIIQHLEHDSTHLTIHWIIYLLS